MNMIASQNLIPRISIVIPLYNKAAHICNTLATIDAQTLPAFEIVIVNDGSTDDGAQKVEALNHPKVRLINQPNQGVSTARNNGIAACRGDYIAFIDADDAWLPHFLEEISYLINQFESAEVYATGYQNRYNFNDYQNPKIHFNAPVLAPQLLTDFFEVCSNGALPFMMSSVVFSKDALHRIGGFPVGEPMGEDQDLFCKAALHCDIAYSPKVLSIYEQDSDNRACLNNIPKQECPFSQRLHQQLNPEEIPKKLYNQIIDFTATHVLSLARLNIEAGNLNVARTLLNDRRCIRKPLKKLINEVRFVICWWQHQFSPKLREQ
jgi:glycosyltransferase involved in cell wall biosynthesis